MNNGHAPSDLELMMYFDGELPEPRRSAVAAFVAADARARNKLTGLRETSAIVQSRVLSLSAADNIADLVMAKISAEAQPGAQVIPLPQRVAAPAHPNLGPQAPVPLALAQRPAANDNSRRIFAAIAAIAVAAAAGLAVWSRMGTEPAASGRGAPVAVYTAQSTVPSSRSSEPELDAAAVTPEADVEPGVEVAAVNFGSHTGSIFFVPSGSIEAKRTTTVVWLADDAGE